MDRERMINEILDDRRGKCIAWVDEMKQRNPEASTVELVRRWFQENPLDCDEVHDAGVYKETFNDQ